MDNRNFKFLTILCLKAAPKDKLLVFNVMEGWEPLCKFLGADVPNKPFPKRNVGGSIVDEYLKHPIMLKCKREMMISTLLLSLLLGYGGFRLFRKSTFTWMMTTASNASQFLQNKCL